MGAGRPSIYSKQLAEEICEQIATTNKGIATILKEKEEYPSERTFYDWLSSKNEEFSQLYARAKERQADRLVTEILEISDETARDTLRTAEGQEYANHEYMNRSRLRVDSRKWLASKLLPKKYGDKLDITTDNKPLNAGIDLSKCTDEELNTIESIVTASQSREV